MTGAAVRPWELEDDRELLSAFRRGETAALERVYRNYAPSVEALLRSGFSYDRSGQRARVAGLASAFDVEDRVHEVFARAFSARGRSGYDGVGAYGAYLYGVTRNLIIDELRKGGRETLVAEPGEHVAGEQVASEPSDAARGEFAARGLPERDAQDRQLVELLSSYRQGLSARDRQVFELRFGEAQAHAEIVARTGLTASQIKTSEKNIRTTLFRYLQRHGYLGGYTASPQGWLRWLRPRGGA